MTRFRKLIVLLAVLVLVPVLLVLVGGLLLPEERIKQELAAGLAEATGAEVVLGDAGVSFWPHLALRLDGGTITGPGAGAAGSLQRYFLEIGRLDVEVGLKALLRREIEVSAVTLQGPRLEVAWDRGGAVAADYSLVLTDLVVPVAAASQAGPGGGQAPGERIPEELSLAFQGRVSELVLQEVPYEELEFSGDLDALILTLESATCRRGTGAIAASGEIDFERDPWGELDFEARADAVPAGTLLLPWAPDLASRLSGDLQAEVSGTCNLRDGPTLRRTLSLVGQVGCGEGTLAAEDWLQDVAPYLGARQDLMTVGFRALNHDFRVDEGRYLIEDLHIDGHQTDWRGSGWVSLEGMMDARLRVKLPAGFTPELGRWSFLAETLRDGEGRVNLTLHLTGPSAGPRVSVDLAGMQGGGATDAVKKGLGGLLDKWKTR
jgi:hypothetical protein